MAAGARRLVVAAAVLLTALPALGDDHEVPTVILRVGEREQAGLLGTFYWTRPIAPPTGAPPGEYCGTVHGDDFDLQYPSPRRVVRGYLATRFEFQKADAPEDLSIRGWTAIEEGDRKGRRGVGYALSPVEEDGQVIAWVADVILRVRKHLYLDVYARWADQEGCPGPQSGTWKFHLKTRRP